MFPTIAIANHFIMRRWRDGVHVSPMKLQKLVYFAPGWYLALFNKPLIDERVEAWKFGPVILSMILILVGLGIMTSSDAVVISLITSTTINVAAFFWWLRSTCFRLAIVTDAGLFLQEIS